VRPDRAQSEELPASPSSRCAWRCTSRAAAGAAPRAGVRPPVGRRRLDRRQQRDAAVEAQPDALGRQLERADAVREAFLGRRTLECAGERRAGVAHDLEVPDPQRALRSGVVRVQLQRAIEMAPAFVRIPLHMRLDRAVELAERQSELEVRIHMLRMARARVGRGKLEQRLLSSFCAQKAASTNVSGRRASRRRCLRGSDRVPRPRGNRPLVMRLCLAESMGVQRLGPDLEQGEQEPHRSNARSRRNGSSKCRRPTKAVAWLPHCRIAPALAMPIGQKI
jgi:hypothetical protein